MNVLAAGTKLDGDVIAAVNKMYRSGGDEIQGAMVTDAQGLCIAVRGNCTPAASGYARGIYGAAETLVNDPVVSIETTRGYVHIHGSDDVAVVVHLPASASS